jgi:hypothetical protein
MVSTRETKNEATEAMASTGCPRDRTPEATAARSWSS